MVKIIKGRPWYCCPHCGKALFPVQPDTQIRNLLFRCKICKHDIKINIA